MASTGFGLDESQPASTASASRIAVGRTGRTPASVRPAGRRFEHHDAPAVVRIAPALDEAAPLEPVEDGGVELTEDANRAAWEAYGPLGEMGAPLVDELSDEDLATVIRFLHGGTKINEERAQQLLEDG